MGKVFSSFHGPNRAGVPQPPLQGGNVHGGDAPPVLTPVRSINHAAVKMQPIATQGIVREVPAAHSFNGIPFRVYSFGGDLPHALRGDAPADLHIEHIDMTSSDITEHIAGTSKDGDQEVRTGATRHGLQTMYSCAFTPCVPVFSLYPPVIEGNAENNVPMALYHVDGFARERLDVLLNGFSETEGYGHPTDIFIVTREEATNHRQSAVALYVNSKLPEGTKLHIIEVPFARISVRVAANKIEVWSM